MTATSDQRRDDPERFDPSDSAGTLVAAEHLARYRAAAGLAAGRRVLDAGCGTGYGTQILIQAGAAAVHGIDVDDVAVRATQAATNGGAEIVRADIHELPFEDASFDVVVCFEVIEHVQERGRAIAEMRRVLTDDGILAISTPNRDVYIAGNPHHVYEYTLPEFDEELRLAFATVDHYGQFARLGSAIVRDASEDHVDGDVVVEILPRRRSDGETYIVSLATSGPALPALAPVAVLAEDFELRWWHDHVEQLDRDRTEAQRQLARDAQAAAEDRARIRELSERLILASAYGAELADLRRRYAEIEGAHRLLLATHQELRDEQAAYREEAERELRTIASVYSSLSWRVTKPLRAVKGVLRRNGS